MLFQERQQIIICAAAGLLVGGFVLFRYLPLQKRLKAIEQRRAAKTLAITKGMSASRQLPALEERLEQLQRAVADYQANVPDSKNLGAFLHGIANLMDEHNLSEEHIEPGEEIVKEKLNCVLVNIQCKGKLAQVFEFYKSLQRLDRSVRIEQVKLANDDNFSGEVSMTTKAIIYYGSKPPKG